MIMIITLLVIDVFNDVLYRSIAMAIMNSPLWKDALEYNISNTSTPFRELIKSMPCKFI